jgi:hypothetical protein
VPCHTDAGGNIIPFYAVFPCLFKALAVALKAGTSLGLAEVLPTFVGWVGVEMTRAKIFAATVAVSSIMLVAAGARFRDARPGVVQPLVEDDSSKPMKKGDRLPWSAPIPLAIAAQPEVASTVALPPEQLPAATEDDIRQAEAEHHRHRDICPRGRTYFTIEHHQYWRCKL